MSIYRVGVVLMVVLVQEDGISTSKSSSSTLSVCEQYMKNPP